MSYNGVGLSTARGSGTNGFIQKNKSYLKPKALVRKDISHYSQAPEHQQKTANKDILDHERKRGVEVKCLELEDELVEAGMDQQEIDERIDIYRKELLNNLISIEEAQKQLKVYQTHQLAEAKERDTKRFGEALGIRGDHEVGAAFNPEKQEQKRLERLKEKEQKHQEYLKRQEEKQERFEKLDREREERDRLRRRSVSPPRDRSYKSKRPVSRSRSRSPPPARRRRRKSGYSDSEDDDNSSRSSSKSRSPPLRRRQRRQTPSPKRMSTRDRSISPARI